MCHRIGVGSEINNYKKKYDYHLFGPRCKPTDDSIMSLAIAAALMESEKESYVLSMRKQPSESCLRLPYGSFGNGAAMWIGPVGQIARSLEEVRMLSKAATVVSHDHPQAVKGAEATAVFLAGSGKSKEEIRLFICTDYYELDFTLDEIRKRYSFDVSCQGSVPQALEAFFESDGFEDAIRGAISIGGDSDTIAAICGSIEGMYYGVPQAMEKDVQTFLDADLLKIFREFEDFSDRLHRSMMTEHLKG